MFWYVCDRVLDFVADIVAYSPFCLPADNYATLRREMK